MFPLLGQDLSPAPQQEILQFLKINETVLHKSRNYRNLTDEQSVLFLATN